MRIEQRLICILLRRSPQKVCSLGVILIFVLITVTVSNQFMNLFGYSQGQGQCELALTFIHVTPRKTDYFLGNRVGRREYLVSVEDAASALFWGEHKQPYL